MLFLFTMIVATTACNSNEGEYKTSPTGVKYKTLVANPEGRAVQLGDVVTFTTELKLNDSLMPMNPEPAVIQVKEPLREGDFYDAIVLMHKGESMLFAFTPKAYLGEQLPPEVKETDMIYLTVNVQEVQTMAEFEAAYMEEMEQLKQEEIKIIEQYLADNNLTAEMTESGLFYVLEKEGKGAQPQVGQTVTVHYTGTLLDGTKFDSSIDRGEPLVFPVGVGQVIPGWDEGLLRMKAGEKGKLLIPSPLAYGDRPVGPIPPNSILIFDVELIKAE